MYKIQVPISDTFAELPLWHTLNHPCNATLITLAARVLGTLLPDLPDPAALVHAPDRELLGGLQSPLDEDATRALGVDAQRPEWLDRGVVIESAVIAGAQRAFYEKHPEFIEAGLRRHGQLLRWLGYDPPENAAEGAR